MSPVATDLFEAMIREAGEGQLIDRVRPKSSALPQLRRFLANADDWGRQRLGDDAPALTPDTLVAEYRKNPHKIRAFLQVLPWASPQILVMVWRMLQGTELQSISMQYAAGASFRLEARLSTPDAARPAEEYSSNDIEDAVVVRHLGIMKTNGKPLFDGFYALNLNG